MDSRQDDLRLLDDLVFRTIANPGFSHGWHQIVDLMRKHATPAMSLQLEQILLARVDGHGLAGFFRASFLDMLTGRPEYLQQAGQIALSLPIFNADRLTTFLQNSWQRVLLDIPGRQAFQQRLEEIGLPAIASALTQWLVPQIEHNKIWPTRTIRELRKIALVAPFLSNIKHPPTLMALQQAEILRRNGYQVVLYSAQEMQGPDFKHHLGSNAYTPDPEFVTAGWDAYLGQDGQVQIGDIRFSLLQRWKNLLAQMGHFDPDLVMFVGLYSGLAAAAYTSRPVLSLGINSLSPMVPADVWLTAQQGLDRVQTSQWSGAFPASMAYYHPYRVQRPQVTAGITRQALGLVSGQVILVTLVSESEARIKDEWAAAMCEVLARNPHVKWLIVGGSGSIPSALQNVRSGQVQCIPFCLNAVDYVSCSDIYVNPPMMGGGFAVAEAMALAVPALSLQGSDGGDKLGSAALPDLPAYFTTLEVWLADADARKMAGLAMQQRFDQHLDLARAADSLKGACELALQHFDLRTCL